MWTIWHGSSTVHLSPMASMRVLVPMYAELPTSVARQNAAGDGSVGAAAGGHAGDAVRLQLIHERVGGVGIAREDGEGVVALGHQGLDEVVLGGQLPGGRELIGAAGQTEVRHGSVGARAPGIEERVRATGHARDLGIRGRRTLCQRTDRRCHEQHTSDRDRDRVLAIQHSSCLLLP